MSHFFFRKAEQANANLVFIGFITQGTFFTSTLQLIAAAGRMLQFSRGVGVGARAPGDGAEETHATTNVSGSFQLIIRLMEKYLVR